MIYIVIVEAVGECIPDRLLSFKTTVSYQQAQIIARKAAKGFTLYKDASLRVRVLDSDHIQDAISDLPSLPYDDPVLIL